MVVGRFCYDCALVLVALMRMKATMRKRKMCRLRLVDAEEGDLVPYTCKYDSRKLSQSLPPRMLNALGTYGVLVSVEFINESCAMILIGRLTVLWGWPFINSALIQRLHMQQCCTKPEQKCGQSRL